MRKVGYKLSAKGTEPGKMPDTAETAHIKAPRSMAHLLRTTDGCGYFVPPAQRGGGSAAVPARFAEQFDTDLSRTVEAIAVGYEHSADHSQSSWPSMQTACV